MRALTTVVLLSTGAVLAQPLDASASASKEPDIAHSVMAPAALPEGALALSVVLGAPDLGVGYRQGFHWFELEGRAWFNPFQVSLTFDLGARFLAYEFKRWKVAPTFGVGLTANTGAVYYDPLNFPTWALRPRLGGVASVTVIDRLAFLFSIDVPVAISLDKPGVQALPLAGAGIEVGIGAGVSLLAFGQLGLDARRLPSGASTTGVGWALRLGVGWRLF